MDVDRIDALARSLSAVGSRRRALTTGLAALVGITSARYHAEPTEAAKRNRKKRNRCTSGPCNYNLCLLYLDTKPYNNNPTLIRKYTPYLSSQCCAFYALSLTGKAYRNAVVSCISQTLAPAGLDG